MSKNIEFRNIPNFENYIISEYGEVHSIDHYSKFENNGTMCNRFQKGKKLKPSIDKDGYIIYRLSLNGKMITKKAHRLVAETFLDNYDESLVVNHIDGNKQNNHYSNIECCTVLKNNIHAYDIGLKNPKNISISKLKKSKLTVDDVIWIREHYIPYDSKYGAKPLSEKFNVSNTTISEIANGKRYSLVK